MPEKGDLGDGVGWRKARDLVQQLEAATARMSPVWLAGNAAVTIAAALFLITAVVLGYSLYRVQDLAEAAEQNQAALLESMALQEALDELGAATRGYALSHTAPNLKDHDASKRASLKSLDRLLEIVGDNEPAAMQMRQVRIASEERIRAFDSLVALAAANAPQSRILAGDPERIRLARAVTARLSIFRAQQTAALKQSQERFRQNTRFASGLVLFAGFAAPLIGLFGIRLLRKVQSDQRTRELQMELMHVQRLAIMGETSAMLAHEINQPLAAASNYLSVLRRHLESGAPEKALPLAERIGQQIQRAGSILKKLRRFIEKRESERSLEAPEGLVEDAITLVGTIDDSVGLVTRIGENLPRVLVDRVQLQQVLVNLMRNAIEAMQDSERRELVLSVDANPDGSVQFSLADSGPGLPDEVAQRLFQPFVSTKKSGMGVGLSICRTIISQNGGRIWAQANPGGGTIFSFVLPAAKELAAA